MFGLTKYVLTQKADISPFATMLTWDKGHLSYKFNDQIIQKSLNFWMCGIQMHEILCSESSEKRTDLRAPPWQVFVLMMMGEPLSKCCVEMACLWNNTFQWKKNNIGMLWPANLQNHDTHFYGDSKPAPYNTVILSIKTSVLESSWLFTIFAS